jgi:transposase
MQVARAAFPKGNPYIRRRDALGPLSTNPTFAALVSHTGRPAEALAHLALMSVMPCAEGLSDAQAADAVRARIDWQYALALALTDPGFDASVLSEFRQRLLTGQAALLLFETLVTLLRAQGLLKAKGRQRTDSTHVLAALQTLHRLECIGETLRHARNVLGALYEPATPVWLRELPAIQTLRQVWLQQFYASPPDQPMRWRSAEALPPAPLLLSSPYAPEARYGKKRETAWTGYKVHGTETGDDETPNLITDVTTTPATTSDFAMLPTMQAHLATRQLTPQEQIVDAGYVTADHLWTSRTDHSIDLIGPAMNDRSWQGQPGNGFAAAQFVSDWDATYALCPQAQRSVVWMERPDRHGHPTVRMAFSKPVCGACTSRADCTRAATAPRALRIRERDHYRALQTARVQQQTDACKHTYASRAGIEGPIAQGTRTGDLRRSRSSELVKTRLMHLLRAAALNFRWVAAWFAEIPRARTRPSAFAALAA